MEILVSFHDATEAKLFWDFLNSQFLSTLVGATVAVLIARYGKRTADAAVQAADDQAEQTFNQQVALAEGELNLDGGSMDPDGDVAAAYTRSGQVPSSYESHEQRRVEVQEKIQKAKNFLEQLANNDPDGRHRQTYKNLNRHDYRVLAAALNSRRQINHDQFAAAIKLFTEWNRFSKGRASTRQISQAAAARFDEHYVELTNSRATPR